MSGSSTAPTHVGVRAQRRTVSDEPLLGGDRYDYADAFEVRISEADSRTAEEFIRAAIDRSPAALQSAIRIAHRYLLRLRLGPPSSPKHIIGWTILKSAPDVVHLEASGPLARGVIVSRRVDPTHAVLTTFVFFRRRATVRILWAIGGPVHRKVTPYLLERTAARPT